MKLEAGSYSPRLPHTEVAAADALTERSITVRAMYYEFHSLLRPAAVYQACQLVEARNCLQNFFVDCASSDRILVDYELFAEIGMAEFC